MRAALLGLACLVLIVVVVVSALVPKWPALAKHHSGFSMKTHRQRMQRPAAQRANVARLHQMCGDIIRALPDPKMLFALYGTLLGLVRRQRLIAYDHDLDLGGLATDFEAVVTALQTHLPAEHYDVLVCDVPGLRVCQVWHKQFGLHADLSFFRRDDQGVYRRDTWVERCAIASDELWPLVPCYCEPSGVTVYLPAQYEAILERKYGPSWRTPNCVEHV